MPWDASRPGSHPRYNTPQHRAAVKAAHADLALRGSGACAEIVCLMPTRLIRPGMDLHLCHDRRTGAVLGLGHARCNRAEAARYARSLQGPPPPRTVYRSRRWRK